MSRPLRIEFEDALYHVTTRGDRAEPIFDDDADRNALLATIEQSLERFDATVFAYCLMGNHYHLVLQTHQPNLSRLMRHINGVYTQTYNRRHAKVGHLFQGRFNAILVDREAYFIEVCRYVDLNPVRAGIVQHPQQWAWSSYRAHTGGAERPHWLDSATLHCSLVPDASYRAGAKAYARFVSQGCGVNLWQDALSGQIYLGDEAFVRTIQARAGPPNDREIPRVQRQSMRRPVHHYLDGQDRDAAMARAYLEGGHTQTEIAGATKLSVSRISRLIAAHQAKGKT